MPSGSSPLVMMIGQYCVGVLVVVALAGAHAARAQASAAPPAGSRDPCSYDACALRLEPGWSGRRLVRGTAGTPVAKLGLFGPDLVPFVQRSDSAVVFARAYRRDRIRAVVLAFVGASVVGAAAAESQVFERNAPDPSGGEWAAMIGGLAVSFVGFHFQYRSERELARALWWHNRDLERP